MRRRAGLLQEVNRTGNRRIICTGRKPEDKFLPIGVAGVVLSSSGRGVTGKATNHHIASSGLVFGPDYSGCNESNQDEEISQGGEEGQPIDIGLRK